MGINLIEIHIRIHVHIVFKKYMTYYILNNWYLILLL